MIQSMYINTALGSLLVLLVLFNDYIRKFNTDNFQRRLFFAVLTFTAAAIVFDSVVRIIADTYAGWVAPTMRISSSLFLIAQNCTYYMTVVLIDYIANKNIERSKFLLKIISIFITVFVISVIFNFFYGFYFYINEENRLARGSLFILRVIISYLPVIFILVDILIAIKQFRSFQIYAIILFLIINTADSLVDFIWVASSLTWPCFTGALLYLYFFIIQFDAKLDTLTGLGNRYSFNEFIGKLSKQNTKMDYSVVMIDLDRFKLINDTYGHLEGDNALKDMAVIISGSIRHSDFAARYGGDEFVLAASAENDIKRVMDRIQNSIDIQNENGNRPYKIYMSYGYDVFTTNSGMSIRKFMNHIDSLMYKQKEEHRRIFAEKQKQAVKDKDEGNV
ncbi:MAG: GGDEF domain-containing protein [Treponema sp.]|nr:GGDEF domain-containing protein [Treponema sp.]